MAQSNDAARCEQIEQMYNHSRQSFPEVPEISAADLKQLLSEEDVVLIDVRTPPEQAVSMLPGAITTVDFETDPDRYADRTIVCYCTIGHRSGLYAQQLVSMGFKARNLKGAILAWTHADGALESASGPTRQVHVFKKKCALTADGYEPTW